VERYRGRARILFGVLSIVAAIGMAIAVGWSDTRLGIEARLGLLVGQMLAIGAFVMLYRALGRGEPWADRATLWVCTILIASGLIRSLVDAGFGRITIPLEAIGAGLVLLGRPRATAPPNGLAPGPRGVAPAVIGAVLLAQLAPSLVTAAPLGVLAAAPDDLLLDVAATCPTTGSPADAATIEVEVAWTWTGQHPLMPVADGLLVGWYATTAGAGQPDSGLYVDDVATSDPAIIAGMDGEPGALLASRIGTHVTSREFVIPRGLPGGSVRLVLLPSDPTTRSGSVEIEAHYAHGGEWLVAAPMTGCGW
jgi:hypothetical protein